MNTLYPELEPYAHGYLEPGNLHEVYVEQAGNPEGIPILFLHGGPGSGCSENHRRYFNPKHYRIILFDQRGCHRSRANGDFEHNTTQYILEDVESIRRQLGIKQLVLFGGSWGATMALLYAERYPEQIAGIILRGAFLARQEDFDWFVNAGVNRLLPDYWAEFASQFEFTTSAELILTIHQQLFSENAKTQLAAAKAWALWAGRVATHGFIDDYQLEIDDEAKLINEARIEMHYAKHRYFIEENQILNAIHRLPDVPIRIIHGRKDLTCLPQSSWLLHQVLSKSELILVNNAGHLANEPAMIDALINATDNMLTQLS